MQNRALLDAFYVKFLKPFFIIVMPLEEYLMPGEEIYTRGIAVRLAGNEYEAILTNMRLLLYARRGLIVKRDELISVKLREIQNIHYREEGLISKRGILVIDLLDRRISLAGTPEAMKSLYQNLMAHWGR